MHFTLLMAGALIPSDLSIAIATSLSLPALQARLARAASAVEIGLRSDTGDAHWDWLAREVFGQTPAPTAPYAYAQLSGKTSPAFLWHADPVHIEAARDHLIMRSLDANHPTADESAQLIEAANSLAAAVGSELICVNGHWFMQCDKEWEIYARPMAAATGALMMLPTGPDSQIWNRLHNEMQMMWQMHPVNQAREGRHQPTVDGVWLHGGGRWRPLPPLRYTYVQTDVPGLQGAALAAGARISSLSAEIFDGSLLIIDQPAVPRKLHDWTAWSQAMAAVDKRLSAHARDTIDLIACGRTVRTFRSRPSDRYISWHRRTLAEALAE